MILKNYVQNQLIKASISIRKLPTYKALKLIRKKITQNSTYADFYHVLEGFRYNPLVCIRFLNHDTNEKFNWSEQYERPQTDLRYYDLSIMENGMGYFHFFIPALNRLHVTENKAGQHPDIQRDVRKSRIYNLKSLSKALKTRLTLFESNWSLVIDPLTSHYPSDMEKLAIDTKLDYKTVDISGVIFPYCLKKCAGVIEKAETHLNQHLKPFMAQQIYTIERLDRFIDEMIAVETGYSKKYDQLTLHYEQQEKASLNALQEAYDRKLETMRTETNQKFIELHQTLQKQQDLIDQLHTMNQAMLETQQNKAGQYETQLLDLLGKLKNE